MFLTFVEERPNGFFFNVKRGTDLIQKGKRCFEMQRSDTPDSPLFVAEGQSLDELGLKEIRLSRLRFAIFLLVNPEENLNKTERTRHSNGFDHCNNKKETKNKNKNKKNKHHRVARKEKASCKKEAAWELLNKLSG